MSPELHFDTFEEDPDDRAGHTSACRRIVHQILFDQARGLSGEESAHWECVPTCRVKERDRGDD